MVRGTVRFGVEVERELDVEFQKLAEAERRSKRNMHQVVLRRLVRLWKEKPDEMRRLQLIQPQ
jgi:hypothetical protein